MPSAAEDVSGRLLLAASYTVIGYFLPYHLQRLSQQYPQLDIQLHELNRSAIEEGLIANRYDMAVLLTSNVANPDLAVEHFFGSPRRLWLPARHPLLERDTVTLEDVAREPFIMLTVDEAAYTALRYWNETPFKPDVRLRTRRSRPCAAWWPTAAAWRCCRTWFTGPGRWKGGASRRSSSGSDSAHERGTGLAQGRGDIAGDAGGARVFPACLYGAAGRPGDYEQ